MRDHDWLAASIPGRQPETSGIWDQLLMMRDAGVASWADEAIDAETVPVSFSPALWPQLDVIATADPPDANVEMWLGWYSDVLKPFLQIRPTQLAVECAAYVGASQFQFVVREDNKAVQLPPGTGLHPRVNLPNGERVVDPRTLAILQAAAEYNNGASRTKEAQLRSLIRIKSGLRSDGSTSMPDCHLKLGEHLRAQSPVAATRMALAWEETGARGVYKLGVSVEGSDGSRRKVRVHQVKEGVWNSDDRVDIVLPVDHQKVVERAKAYQLKTAREGASAMADPSMVLPPDADASLFDLTGYSSRVLGFEPLLSTRVYDAETSGVDWMETAGARPHGDAFLNLAFGEPRDDGKHILSVATREDAETLLLQLKPFLDGQQVGLLRFQGRDIQPSQALHDRVQSALNVSDGSRSVQVAPERSAEAAVVAERDEAVTEMPPEEEHPIPQAALDVLLLPTSHLKPHQTAGLGWLWSCYALAAKHGTPDGVILADDMGLGKTLQVLGLLALAQHKSFVSEALPSIVVAPVALLSNWQAEMEQHFSSHVFAGTLILHGDEGRRLVESGPDGLAKALGQARTVLTTYEFFGRHQKALLKVKWHILVLDEAHRAKNPDTLHSRAASASQFTFAVAMTGTPIENKLADMWTLLDIVRHGASGPLKSFSEKYETDPPSVGAAALKAALKYTPEQTHHAQRLVRRNKYHLGLPPKTEQVARVPLTFDQAESERQLRKRVTDSSGSNEILGVLQKMDALYQHPWLLTADAQSLRKVALPDTARLMTESPKLSTLIGLLRQVSARGEKALVFARLAAMQRILIQTIKDELGLDDVPLINGDVTGKGADPVRGPQAIIKRLSQRKGFGVMVLSPIAAGVGLNITAANHVFHYGRWWNPAKEDQATDRAYRIGQTLPVSVHVLLAHDPADEARGYDLRLHQLLTNKRALARDVLDPVAGLEFSSKDQKELLG